MSLHDTEHMGEGKNAYLLDLQSAVKPLMDSASQIQTELAAAAAKEGAEEKFKLAAGICGAIGALNHEEYAHLLVTVLHELQEKKDTLAPAPLTQKTPDSTKQILALLEQLETTVYHKKVDAVHRHLLNELLLAARSLYPFGINAINPENNPKAKDGLRDDVPVVIMAGGTPITVQRVNERGQEMEIEFPVRKEDKPLTFARVPLPENSSRIIGRSPRAPIFGRTCTVDVPDLCDVENMSGISRAGIQVVRKNGHIYIFDRGCTNAIRIVRDGMAFDYAPGVQQDDAGQSVVGKTKIVQLDEAQYALLGQYAVDKAKEEKLHAVQKGLGARLKALFSWKKQ